MVKALQGKAVQVCKVSGYVQLGELPLSARQVLRPRQPSREQHHRLVELFAMTDDSAVLRHVHHLGDQPANGLLLLCADVVSRTQLLEMGFNHGSLLTAEKPPG